MKIGLAKETAWCFFCQFFYRKNTPDRSIFFYLWESMETEWLKLINKKMLTLRKGSARILINMLSIANVMIRKVFFRIAQRESLLVGRDSEAGEENGLWTDWLTGLNQYRSACYSTTVWLYWKSGSIYRLNKVVPRSVKLSSFLRMRAFFVANNQMH